MLSFIAGLVDTAVFVGLFGLFTAHVTGNFVLIGWQLVHHTGDIWPKLLAFPAFVVAVAATVKVVEARSRGGKPAPPLLLWIEAALLLCAFAAAAADPVVHASDPAAIAAGMLAAAAMGVQNAMMRLELASLPSTTVMTINVTQGVVDAVALLSGGQAASRRDEARKRFARTWPQIMAFAAGSAAGALGYAATGFAVLVLPGVLCVALGVLWKKAQAGAPAAAT